MADPEPQAPPTGLGFALAFSLTVAGGLLMAASYVTDLPSALDALGGVAFLLGTVIVFAVAFRIARRESVSFVRALGSALRDAGRWVVAFFP